MEDADSVAAKEAQDRLRRQNTRLSRCMAGLFVVWMAVWFTLLLVTQAIPEWAQLPSLYLGPLIAAGIIFLFPRELRSRVGQQVGPAILELLRWCSYVIVPCAGYLAIRWLSGVGITWLRFVGLGLFALIITSMAFVISTKSSRTRLLKVLPDISVRLMFAATLVFLAAGFFAAITMELVDDGLVALTPTPVDAGQLADFYMWHLIDAIPGDLLSTLRVPPRFTYEQTLVGVLVVTYNLTIVIPAIAWIRAAVKRRDNSEGVGVRE